jgi:HlyD family secretion protein
MRFTVRELAGKGKTRRGPLKIPGRIQRGTKRRSSLLQCDLVDEGAVSANLLSGRFEDAMIMKRRILILVLLAAAVAGGLYYAISRQSQEIVLTGIVTTDEIIVSPEIQGRLQEMLVKQGDKVTNGQLLAVIQPREWKEDVAFYSHSEEQSAAQVTQGEAELRYQEAQTSNLVVQAQANLAATEAQVVQAEADLELARQNLQREDKLYKQGVDSAQVLDQMRAASDSAMARVDSLRKQVQAAKAAVELARATEEQVLMRRAMLEGARHQRDAAVAQKEKAKTKLDYTELRAPTDGIVDVRAALQGEVVNPAQAVVTLLNPDDLWVRADVEESFIDRVKLGDKMNVRLPSGARREGTVFYRAVDADYATQRDVSRTKRDIKTFEIRIRCDNHDRALAVGMTAYVLLPL